MTLLISGLLNQLVSFFTHLLKVIFNLIIIFDPLGCFFHLFLSQLTFGIKELLLFIKFLNQKSLFFSKFIFNRSKLLLHLADFSLTCTRKLQAKLIFFF